MKQMDLFTPPAAMSQSLLILNHLRIKGSITALEAMSLYRIFRLAARVNELRDEGYDIETDMKTDLRGKRYASYSL